MRGAGSLLVLRYVRSTFTTADERPDQMPHPAPFYRVTAEGILNQTEAFSFGFNIIRWPGSAQELPAVSEALANNIGNIVADWFGGQTPQTPGITDRARLEVVKVNRIGVDGHYQDPESREFAVVPPRPGQSAATTTKVPPQNALVVSLIGTDNPRALAGKGRFYLPPVQGMGEVGPGGLLNAMDVTRVADAAEKLIEDINGLFGAIGARYAGVGNTSPGGSGRPGREQIVSSIRVGNVVDTIRSRRRSLVETYTERAIA